MDNQKHTLVEAGGIQIASRLIGADKAKLPLVLIMGFGCTMDMWPRELIDELSKTRKLALFDNRGMGFSSSGSGFDFSIKQFAADTKALLTELNITKADFMGWSMGGMIALQFAADYPEMINDILLYSSYLSNKPLFEDKERWKKLTDMTGTIEERLARMFANLFPKQWLADNPNPLEFFPEMFEPVNDDAIILQAEAIKKWKGLEKEVHSIRNRTLALTGSEDSVIPYYYSFDLAKKMPNASALSIKGAGHGLMYQKKEEFIKAVSDFFGEQQ